MGSTTLFKAVFINPEQVVRFYACTKKERKRVVNVCEFLRCITFKILLEGLGVCHYISQEPGNNHFPATLRCPSKQYIHALRFPFGKWLRELSLFIGGRATRMVENNFGIFVALP